ncbi:MAG TPA: hypothetical protein VJ927_05985 [Actinomycetota bacterium]|nr:hypothetical protein [Actinomycetota bacterium]
MLWAGPIEFSTGEVIAILLILAAMALAIPVAAGAIAVIVYRRRTPPRSATGRQATIVFFKFFALALALQVAIGFVIGLISALLG